MYYILFVVIIAFGSVTTIRANKQNISTGLFFKSFETDKDNRTGLNLTSEDRFNFPEGFTISFDVKLRVEVQTFGYLFRIIGNDTLNIDLLSYQFDPDGIFTLTLKKESLIQYTAEELGHNINRDWIHFSLTLNPSTNKIHLFINNLEKVLDYSLDGIKKYDICFGKNGHDHFFTTDVAPFILRDIRIFDQNQHLEHYWKLREHAENAVFDECKGLKATTINPSWEIDEHVRWKKNITFQLSGQHYQFAFDRIKNRIFISRDNKLLVYYPNTGESDTIMARKGYPYNVEPNQMLYNPNTDELISYDYEKRQVATFSFSSYEWTNNSYAHIPTRFWHHGSYYRKKDNSIVIFGGYGQHTYSNLLQKYSLVDNEWKILDFTHDIQPRYLGSMAELDDDSFIYFGGYGSESGKQEEGVHNFYQLFKVDLERRSTQVIWELEGDSKHFANSNSMVIDTENNVFYTLEYPNDKYATHISLIEYKQDSPLYTSLADTLPYIFNDIDSYCNLYQSSDNKKLYALVSEVKNENSEITIYSIAYPPLTVVETIQDIPSYSWFSYITVIIGCLLLAIIFPTWYFRMKKNDIENSTKTFIHINKETDENEDMAEEIIPAPSINLLGRFKIINKNGEEIKEKFSPTTQQFFILILLNTIRHNGISPDEINRLFWEEKDDVSARNLRNVYIKKSRDILNELECLKLVKEKGYWRIIFDEDIFCDYMRVVSIINMVKRTNDISREVLAELLNLTSRGNLLPYMETPWIDRFKAEFSSSIIETITWISQSDRWKKDFDILLAIADIILIHDNTEEYGIKLKCSTLLYMKRNVQARNAYTKFVEDYEKLLSSKPDFTFENILKNNTS
jgi:two-component SAPR family response regulator